VENCKFEYCNVLHFVICKTESGAAKNIFRRDFMEETRRWESN
jgi:hypothetical protein